MRKRFIHFFLLIITVGLTLFIPFRVSNSLNNHGINDQSMIHSSVFYNDAFYYLNYAHNNKTTGYESFDKEYPSNGYHFLWQKIVNQLAYLTGSKGELITSVFYLCLILTLFSYLFIFYIVYQITKSSVLSIFTIFPGFFFLIFSVGIGVHYNPWSIINGLESSLSLFFFSVILYVSYLFYLEKFNLEKYILSLSFLISLLVLSRLDEGFLLFGFLAVLLLKKQKLRLISIFLVAPVIIIILYVVYNYANYGLLLPVSGIVKSSFYPENIIHVFNCFLSGRSFLDLSSQHLYSRVLPLLLPPVIVPILGKYFQSSFLKNEKIYFLLNAINIYLIGKSLYLLLFVDFWSQGQWYFYNQIMLMNIFIAVFIHSKTSDILEKRYLKLISFILIVLTANMIFFRVEARIMDSEQLKKNNHNRINQLISDKIPDGKIIEFDDGIIAFAVENNCLSGFCLAGDKKLYEHFKQDKLLEEAYRRGYRYIASVNYFRSPEQIPDAINKMSDFIQEPFKYANQFDDNKWKYELIIKDNISNLILIKFDKQGID